MAVGDHINQSISNVVNKKIESTVNELKQLGVPEDDLNELKTIIENETNYWEKDY